MFYKLINYKINDYYKAFKQQITQLSKSIDIKKMDGQKLKNKIFMLRDFLYKKKITLKNFYIGHLLFFPKLALISYDFNSLTYKMLYL